MLCGRQPPPLESQHVRPTWIDADQLRMDGISSQAIHLLSRMLAYEPELRATDVECLNHPWISKGQTNDIACLAEPLSAMGKCGEEIYESLFSQQSLEDYYSSDLVYDTDGLGRNRALKRFKPDTVGLGGTDSDPTPTLGTSRSFITRASTVHSSGPSRDDAIPALQTSSRRTLEITRGMTDPLL